MVSTYVRSPCCLANFLALSFTALQFFRSVACALGIRKIHLSFLLLHLGLWFTWSYFCRWQEIGGWLRSFVCAHPVVPETMEKATLSPPTCRKHLCWKSTSQSCRSLLPDSSFCPTDLCVCSQANTMVLDYCSFKFWNQHVRLLQLCYFFPKSVLPIWGGFLTFHINWRISLSISATTKRSCDSEVDRIASTRWFGEFYYRNNI